jgi:hypothetical protein
MPTRKKFLPTNGSQNPKRTAANGENNDFDNPKYSELLFKYYYTEHILRKPLEEWPESINRCFQAHQP